MSRYHDLTAPFTGVIFLPCQDDVENLLRDLVELVEVIWFCGGSLEVVTR